jgi:hypothetical protein
MRNSSLCLIKELHLFKELITEGNAFCILNPPSFGVVVLMSCLIPFFWGERVRVKD